VSAGRRLRDLLDREELVVAPGAYDALTARLVEEAGFGAVYMTGAGTSASLGYPDYGLVTLTEMVENAGRLARAVQVPVIADCDTGYGNELNAIRAVEEFTRRGVAGVHVEDQVFPKRCGHLEEKEVIPVEDFVAKVRAMSRHRPDPDLFLIARTDARAPLGLAAAVERANAAIAAGADCAFVEAPQTREEVEAVPSLVRGPCLFNLVPGGRSPEVSLADLDRFGYRAVILPTALLAPVVLGGREALRRLRTEGEPAPSGTLPPRDLFRLVGSEAWDLARAGG
jgi:2-methylisocitrate lyase-like PEP mutase family enzyme